MVLNEQLHAGPRRATFAETAVMLCQAAKEAEGKGDFEGAREALSVFWKRIGDRPNVEGLEQHIQAEVLLRVGTLTGKIGSAKQIPGAQELARDLISESAALFEQLSEGARVGEARTNLAYCYFREARFDEARIILTNALSLLAPADYDLKIRALVLLGCVEAAANRLVDALAVHGQTALIIDNTSDEFLLGIFHSEYGTVLKNLGLSEGRRDYADRALIELAAAAFYFERVGNVRYGAAVENNTGSLYSGVGDFDKACEHYDRARSKYVSLNDTVCTAQVDENRARAYIGQNNPLKALKIVKSAVQALEGGGEAGVLAETLITFGVCLARTNSREQAEAAFVRAACLAIEAGDREGSGRAWLAMLEELPEIETQSYLGAYNAAYSLLSASQDSAIKGRLLSVGQKIISKMGADKKGAGDESDTLPEGFSLIEAKRDFEKACIEKALRATHGNALQASRLLGLPHHQRIYQLMKEHGIDNPEGRKRLKSLATAPARPKVEMIGEMLIIDLPDDLKDLPLITHRVTNEALSSFGVHEGDEIIVYQTREVEVGQPAGVRVPGLPLMAGTLREEQDCIYLESADTATSAARFRKDVVAIEGRVVGFCKAEDVRAATCGKALKFYPIG